MSSSSAPLAVRPYHPSDERGWVRCRVLSFLDTQYYDDVAPRRRVLTDPSISLVAVGAHSEVVGILDIEIDGSAATIDTIATHPDHQGAGIATALLHDALPRLASADVLTLDAWTREDAAANRWYRRNGFTEQSPYLHVYAHDVDGSDFATPDGLSAPVIAFMHGRLEDEVRMRERFRRVYVCRRYVRPVLPA
ncbi:MULTISPECIES: GNAT family N-acetyltransferase [unclassified Microbacterium]|uniref:GNAT family N-acetyltransferase n=1 Tax=unclassified Microbacterium TaxID=2609290 RepID=UPI003018EA25